MSVNVGEALTVLPAMVWLIVESAKSMTFLSLNIHTAFILMLYFLRVRIVSTTRG